MKNIFKEDKLILWTGTIKRETPDGIPILNSIVSIEMYLSATQLKILDEIGLIVTAFDDIVVVVGITKAIVKAYAIGFIDAHIVTGLAPNRSLVLSNQN